MSETERERLIKEQLRRWDKAAETKPRHADQSIWAGVGRLLGMAFTWLWLGAIAFGVIGALLSPGSCSGSNRGQEYRQR